MYIIEAKIDCNGNSKNFKQITEICEALAIVIREHIKCNSVKIEVAYEFEENEKE